VNLFSIKVFSNCHEAHSIEPLARKLAGKVFIQLDLAIGKLKVYLGLDVAECDSIGCVIQPFWPRSGAAHKI
jgi:hypothetical protein